MTKQILDKSDVAARTGRHVKTIERWIREGFFPWRPLYERSPGVDGTRIFRLVCQAPRRVAEQKQRQPKPA